MENPLQAIVAGTAVAVPVLRLARGFSLPLLMIGAGLALTSKTVRDRATEAASPAIDRGRGVLDDVKDGLSSAQSQASSMAKGAQAAAAGVADDLQRRTAEAASTVGDTLRSGGMLSGTQQRPPLQRPARLSATMPR
jgi:hypothetical protein